MISHNLHHSTKVVKVGTPCQTYVTPLFREFINTIQMEIKTNTTATDGNSNLLLTGILLLANMDYNSFLDYGIKAMIGGFIWMGFKIASEYVSGKMKNK
jgi:hypothetical protein